MYNIIKCNKISLCCSIFVCAKITANTGKVAFTVAEDTYPSNAYFEKKVVSEHGNIGAMFIAQPATSDEEGIIFCNVEGEGEVDNDFDMDCDHGSK